MLQIHGWRSYTWRCFADVTASDAASFQAAPDQPCKPPLRDNFNHVSLLAADRSPIIIDIPLTQVRYFYFV